LIEYFIDIDQKFFLFLNGIHSPFWDKIMLLITTSRTWIPFYLFLIYIIFKNNKVKTGLWLVVVILISVGLALCGFRSYETLLYAFEAVLRTFG